jgi:hypothetical protein
MAGHSIFGSVFGQDREDDARLRNIGLKFADEHSPVLAPTVRAKMELYLDFDQSACGSHCSNLLLPDHISPPPSCAYAADSFGSTCLAALCRAALAKLLRRAAQSS